MSDTSIIEQALSAARAGDKTRARDLLSRHLKDNPGDVEAWLWLGSVVETAKEQVYCLQQVERLSPGHPLARQGLLTLGAGAPGIEPPPPAPLVRRRWEVKINEGANGLTISPRQWIMLGGAGILVILLLSMGVLAASRPDWLPFGRRLTVTPLPWTPIGTPTVTLAAATGTPTPRSLPSPTLNPFALDLDVVYTATPLYVNTPHGITEAYRLGLRALEDGNIAAMLDYMQQASSADPLAADLVFYVGEAQRMAGNLPQALMSYDRAIQLNPQFAPAYLGRAHVNLAINEPATVQDDLDRAIDLDVNFLEAYLARADYALQRGDAEAGLEDTQFALQLNPDAPLAFAQQAQALLLLDQPERAQFAAETALQRDARLLVAYLWLAEAYAGQEAYSQALQAVQIYLFNTPEDEQRPQAYMLQARMQYATGADANAVLDALESYIDQVGPDLEAILLRGEVYLDLQDGQQAVNAFVEARRLAPRDFAVNEGLGRALLLAGRAQDAIAQFNVAENLAETDLDFAKVYYGRAQAHLSRGPAARSIDDWEALLGLPADSVDPAWITEARQMLAELYTPTPSPTSSPTLTVTPEP